MGFSSSRPLPFVALFMKHYESLLTLRRTRDASAAALNFDFLMFEGKTARVSPLFPAEQIRAVTAGFLDSSGPPPLFDFRVVSSDQNLGNGPAAVFRGSRVVWKIQQNLIRNL